MIGIGLCVEEVSSGSIREEFLPFENPGELQCFLSKINLRLERNAECCSWNGFELELLGESAEYVSLLQKALGEWRQPKPLAVSEILDLTGYSQRIEGFGVEKPYCCPFIARKDNGLSWVPQNLTCGFFYTSDDTQGPVAIELDGQGLAELKARVQLARDTNSGTLTFPGCPRPIRREEAEQILSTLDEVKHAVSHSDFKPQKLTPLSRKSERFGLEPVS